MKKNRVNPKDKQRKEQLARLEHLSRRGFILEALKTGAAALSIPSMVSAMLTESTALGASLYDLAIPLYQYHANGGPASLGVGPLGVAAAGPGLSSTPLGAVAQQAYGYDAASLTLRDAFGTKFVDFSSRVITGQAAAAPSFISAFLAELTPAQQLQIMAVKFVVDSQDDNNTNLCGITKVYENSGLFKPPALVESAAFRATETGMDNSSPFASKIPPYVVQNASDIPGQRNFSSLIPSTTQPDRDKIGLMAQAAISLTNRHLGGALVTEPQQAKRSLSDAVTGTLGFVNPAGASLDPKASLGGTFATTFGITAGTANNDANYRLAMSLAYMMNSAGGQRDIHTVVESAGGYDYHGNTAVSTQAKDASLGTRLGKVARTALDSQKDLILIQTADGAVSCNPDPASPIFATGDRGILGAFTLYFVHGDPGTSFVHDLVQVGKIGADGRVDISGSGKNDLTAAIAMASNVLHLNGVSDDEIMRVFETQFPTKAHMLALRAISRQG